MKEIARLRRRVAAGAAQDPLRPDEGPGARAACRGAVAVGGRLAVAVPPASGAVVMGTGIVSIGLALDGEAQLSDALLALASVVWLLLAAVVLALVLRRRPLVLEHARSPAVLTGVAGTDVLGARVAMLGWSSAALTLLALGVLLWLLLVPSVLAHWRRPTVGVSFVLVVATESLAVLAAALGAGYGAPWLAIGALACVGLGLGLYVFVVSAFDLRQLLVGRGDHWVAGGALAIATLACARTAQAAAALGPLRPAAGSLDTAALALWAAAAVWLPALLGGEAVSRRTAYDVRRWSTVFPLGMYAVCSFADARVDGLPGIDGFARVWIWVAFAVWLVVFAGLLRRVTWTVRAAARAEREWAPAWTLARNVTMMIGEMAAAEQRVSIHRALADERRSRIAAELEAAPDGLDVQQLAERLELHANTIRWHLGILADAGIVSSRTAERSAPGRPRILYTLAPGSETGGRDEYRLLATILAGTLAGRLDGPEQAAEAGRVWGRYLVPTPQPGTRPSEEEATAEVAELLRQQGFAPRVEGDAICMYRCPFAELATTHPQIVCTLHRGLIDGALEELGVPLETTELEVFPQPDRCIAHLARSRRDP